MQIICSALMLGVMTFAAMAIFINQGQGNAAQPPRNGVIAYVAAGFAAIICVVRIILPPMMVKSGIQELLKARRVEELTRLEFYPIFQIQMIVGCALLEGAGLFNVIAYLVEGQTWSLAIVTWLVALIGISIPTVDKVNNWADDRLRQIQLDPPQPN